MWRETGLPEGFYIPVWSNLAGFAAGAVFSVQTIFVVVDGDIGVIDGQCIGQGSGYGCGFGLVGGEDTGCFGFADVGVVQTVNRIGNRVGLAQISLLSISLPLPALMTDTLASLAFQIAR